MIILASDTSSSSGSVALRGLDGETLKEELDSARPHSETLLPAVERILARAGLNRKDVQALAVGTGPGAFTGLRVGLATFKAWAMVTGLPLIPVVSLDAVALPFLKEGTPVVVLSDARKGEVYAAYYPSLENAVIPYMQGEVILIPHESVPYWVSSLNAADACFAGTALPLLEEKGLSAYPVGIGGSGTPDANWILVIAEALMSLGRTVDPSDLVPCYVRPPDAKKPASGTIVTRLSDDTGDRTDS